MGAFDGSDLVFDTIPIPGVPDGSEVINPSRGILPDDLSPVGIVTLALVGIGFGVGGFFGGGALAVRGLNGGLHPPDPGHSQSPPPDDDAPSGQV